MSLAVGELGLSCSALIYGCTKKTIISGLIKRTFYQPDVEIGSIEADG